MNFEQPPVEQQPSNRPHNETQGSENNRNSQKESGPVISLLTFDPNTKHKRFINR